MTDLVPFGLVVLVVAGSAVLAVLSNRVSEKVNLPAPAIFLVCAAVVSQLKPELSDLSHQTVERIVTIAVAAILFDGGMHIGWSRLRRALGAVLVVGVVGTFVTAGAMAVLIHLLLGFDWWISLLVATAIAPTDPAVVFSVLGRREVAGLSGTLLEAESGANDPVGIALMGSLLAAGAVNASALGQVAAGFVLQMAVGSVVGVVGGAALLWFMRRVSLPSEALYPLRALAGGLVIFGLASVAHGSGFLAIFVAGIVLGDARAPFKAEVARFVSAVASLGEIVAFVVLGLTVDLSTVAHADVWLPGLALAALLAFAVRPLLVGLLMARMDLRGNEKTFVLWAGLKGAVPILLGTFLLSDHVAGAPRLYGIIVVLVTFSVVVQGGLVPTVAQRLRVPMRMVEPEPWALGVRLRDEPEGVHRYRVTAGSPADGTRIRDLPVSTADVWVTFVVRDGQLVRVRGHTALRADDEIVILADPHRHHDLAVLFSGSGPPDSADGPPPQSRADT
jgi:cell volume regulation protein A